MVCIYGILSCNNYVLGLLDPVRVRLVQDSIMFGCDEIQDVGVTTSYCRNEI
jgi:hypothetical protein